MTVSMMLKNGYKLIFSDGNFKPMRKKPTISVYIEELNVEQKIASFNSQQTFEWFLKEVLGVEVNDGIKN